MSASQLFSPVQVGNSTLAHRIVLAPLTRQRANIEHVPSDLAVEYYAQRASVPGTLLITEATLIAKQAGNYPNAPGIWSKAQIAKWKNVTDAVHARGSYIHLQLWALGRAGHPDDLALEDPSLPYVSSSPTLLAGMPRAPRALTADEIAEYVQLYATAASNAVHGAGFDGVEVHGANGYLIDQFIQDVVNVRTDAYGGSIENRVRFPLAVVDAVVRAVGAERTALRLSPWSKWQGMGMTDPVPTFSHLIRQIRAQHPDLAYLHLVQPRIEGVDDEAPSKPDPWATAGSNDFARKLWAPKPLVLAGAFTPESAKKQSDKHGDLIAFGRHFISNPDLPTRIARALPLTPYNPLTFYTKEAAEGYVDYVAAVAS